ncbi:putative bifunctional diguanylate cyclase/phosphodiesterase [Pelagerythrobacter rhizovicinus]|uniref:EAL domain-containing protein n=1 Tax=Pelagerythrobacter rhizovicinus TaxID=2268576 RepID=A0A4Q2KM71_9SPHN|nr:EAL domain-containing protein [Pelagerythrobacter rhizovicinus]RXZ66428.1 EAL domain-containing protein [Pelagerythrobacter rhizovicinus]
MGSRKQTEPHVPAANRDLVAMGIAAAAILMFIGTGGSVLPKAIRGWLGTGPGPDDLLVSAMLLNIALIIFGWRRYVELVAEIEQRKAAEERARELADTDPLTGCLNRRSLPSSAEGLIARCSGTANAVAFVMIDLDNFKQINDLNGHIAGDKVLRETAQRLRAVLPPETLIARLGGDEFACVLPYDAANPSRIDRLTERMIERIAEPVDLSGHSAEITVSIGLASTLHEPFDGISDAQAFLHRADIAMYHAKKRGKNRYYWFEPQMENERRFRNALEAGIRAGLANGEFVPYYEQQIDIETGSLTGFEMLARWNSPRFGLVSPEVFIPVAEDMGVIPLLSEQLIERALEDAKRWDPALTLSVNISPLQLNDPWFAQRMLKLLVKHNFPPQRFEIEITESCLHENVALVRSMILSLRNQGIKISLDDFGTGYSSLAQLRSLPFDRIKIDRSFVSEMGQDGDGSKIVDAIVSLGEGLGMPITAEGIEDDAVLARLRELGQLKGQGYIYGRPETIEQVRERLGALGRLTDNAPDGAETMSKSA